MNRSKKGYHKEPNYEDRRSSPRLPPAAFPSLKGVCLVSGTEVVLINISKGGALLECAERLAPSTRVSLRVITSEGIIQLYGQILRSTISHLNGGLRYRSAVAFEQEFPLQPEATPSESQKQADGSPEPRESPPVKPDAHIEPKSMPDQSQVEEDGLVTLTARVPGAEPDICKLFQINKW
ncbi:MAG TPA: PilZ domain-containing protein [Acidobacteriota bacterium]|nr:PilZ domain-containing protein [Acidobacteriota bacterium]